MSDREKLIELIRKGIGNIKSYEVMQLKLGNAEEIADRLISNGVTLQKWIPVSERLPEDWERVLVRLRTGGCVVAERVEEEVVWRTCWNHDLFEEYHVTHWMPLPKPPKECE